MAHPDAPLSKGRCPKCNGSGQEPCQFGKNDGFKTCSACHGSGTK